MARNPATKNVYCYFPLLWDNILQNSVDYEEESSKKSVFAARGRPSTDYEEGSPKKSILVPKGCPSMDYEDETPKKSIFSAKNPADHVEFNLADFPPNKQEVRSPPKPTQHEDLGK
ncbi:hypothetical protein K438DRAFT_1773400 [Mycena galopus ATCC 62051]|nr:hypothetical protein K438DRAFT_1773400 [Mycena galopus ATCC 62051]